KEFRQLCARVHRTISKATRYKWETRWTAPARRETRHRKASAANWLRGRLGLPRPPAAGRRPRPWSLSGVTELLRLRRVLQAIRRRKTSARLAMLRRSR